MIKKLAKSVGEYKKNVILSPLFVAGEVVMEVLLPFIMANLIDKGIETGDMSHVLKTGLLLLACAMVSLLCGVMAGRNSGMAAAGFAKNLRQRMYYKVQEFSFGNIDKFSTSSIVTRVTTDVSNVQMAFMMIIRAAIRSPLMLISSLVMAFTVSPRLAVIFLCVIPVLAAGLLTIVSHAHPIFEKVFRVYDRLNNVVQENLRGIRVVKSFVREEHEKKKFDDVSQRIYDLFTRAERLVILNAPFMQLCMYTSMLLISWFGAKMVVGGSLTTGELTSIFSYATQVLMSLMMFSMVFVMITISKASAERIVEILDEEVDLTNPEHDPVMEVKDGSIVFDHVDFSYSKSMDKLVLKDIDLEIKSGEVVGVIGGTGSAKSSLVQLIPRLYDVTSGTVRVGGVDVRDYDVKTLRDSVAMVLQKNELFSGTIKENLRWGDENATDEELVQACRLAQADGFINQMPDGYNTYIERGGANVSGGQKQRLCIARALLKKPKILILDDSTSAVDTATDAQIRQGFREYIPETTKIIIAQRISSIEDADKIIVLDGGRINGFGTHEQLLAENDIYREVYTSQTKGGEE